MAVSDFMPHSIVLTDHPTFPAARSRVVIRLAENTKAKPDANTRPLRPDKCLVESSLAPGLRPSTPRCNTGANAATTQGRLGRRVICFGHSINLAAPPNAKASNRLCLQHWHLLREPAAGEG